MLLEARDLRSALKGWAEMLKSSMEARGSYTLETAVVVITELLYAICGLKFLITRQTLKY